MSDKRTDLFSWNRTSTYEGGEPIRITDALKKLNPDDELAKNNLDSNLMKTNDDSIVFNNKDQAIKKEA